MKLDLDLISYNGELNITVHIGKLETLLTVNIDELDNKHYAQIMTILNAHVESLDTSTLLKKLA